MRNDLSLFSNINIDVGGIIVVYFHDAKDLFSFLENIQYTLLFVP